MAETGKLKIRESAPDPPKLLDLPADVLRLILDPLPLRDVRKLRHMHSFFNSYAIHERRADEFTLISILQYQTTEVARLYVMRQQTVSEIRRGEIPRFGTALPLSRDACRPRRWPQKQLRRSRRTRLPPTTWIAREYYNFGEAFRETALLGRFRATQIQLSQVVIDSSIQALIINSGAKSIEIDVVSGSPNLYLPVPSTCRTLAIRCSANLELNPNLLNLTFTNRLNSNSVASIFSIHGSSSARRRLRVPRDLAARNSSPIPSLKNECPVIDLTAATGLESLDFNGESYQMLFTAEAKNALNNLRAGISTYQALETLRSEIETCAPRLVSCWECEETGATFLPDPRYLTIDEAKGTWEKFEAIACRPNDLCDVKVLMLRTEAAEPKYGQKFVEMVEQGRLRARTIWFIGGQMGAVVEGLLRKSCPEKIHWATSFRPVAELHIPETCQELHLPPSYWGEQLVVDLTVATGLKKCVADDVQNLDDLFAPTVMMALNKLRAGKSTRKAVAILRRILPQPWIIIETPRQYEFNFFGRYVVQSRSRFETMVVWRSDFPGLTRVDLDGSPITWEQFRGLFCGQRKTFKVNLLYLSGRRKAVQVPDKFLEMAHQARFRAREIQLSSTNTDPGVMALVAESCPETITVTDTSGSADEYLPVPETCRNLSIYWNRRAPNFEEPNQYKVAPVVDLTKATGLEKIEINCREQKRMMTPLAMVAFNNLRLGIKIDQAKQSLIDELHETFIGIPVWRFLESDHRYYMLHQNVSFFIEKSAEVAS
ncbi:unnamed protein product, partial [Mesorhabditis spiculigera]